MCPERAHQRITLFERASTLIEHIDLELTIRGLLSIYRRNQAAVAP